MTQDILDWNTVNWRKVYRHTHRPIQLRGISSSYLSIRAVGLVLILFCALIMPGTQIKWDWSSVLIFLAVLIWLGWVLYPVVENQWARRFVFRAHVERKLEASFWQKEMRPVIIVIQKAFRITSQGKLIETNNWLGPCRIRIPAWLLQIVEEKEEVDLLCLSTRRILGRLEEFSNP
jgi:hypothetical protein